MLPGRARVYVSCVIGSGAILAVGSWFTTLPEPEQLLTFALLTFFATIANTGKVFVRSTGSWHVMLVFLFAGLLLLPFPLYTFLVILPLGAEQIADRFGRSTTARHWLLYPFHASVYVIAGALARWIFLIIAGESASLTSVPSLVGATVAVGVFVLADRLLVNQAFFFVQFGTWLGFAWEERDTILADLTFPLLGYIYAVLWSVNPLLIAPALVLLYLVSRSAIIPQLKREAQMDPKTGLLNARYWRIRVQNEFERALRFERPMSLIMADLDLLRTVNNVYGHLAGDIVLSGVAGIISNSSRDYDIVGRFGGEEFAIVLPEVGIGEARLMAERLRLAVEAHEFAVPTNRTPIRVTMSFGVACFPQDADSLDVLIHKADLALYQAKLNGRNRTAVSEEIPLSLDLDEVSFGDYTLASHELLHGRRHPDTNEPVDDEHPLSPATPGSIVTRPPHRAAPGVDDSTITFRAHGSRLLWLASVGATAALTAFTLAGRPTTDYTVIAAFGLMAMVASMFQIDLYGRGPISVAPAFLAGGSFLAGIPGAAIISLMMVAATYVSHPRSLRHTMFDWSRYFMGGTLFALIPHLIPDGVSENDTLFAILLAVPISIVSFLVVGWLDSYARKLSGSEWTLSEIWRDSGQWRAVYGLTLGVSGVLAGVAYFTAGPMGLLVFSMPVVLLYFAQQQYTARTKSSALEHRRMNAELMYANREIIAASQAINRLNEELFITLSKIIDARDPDVHGHAQRVAELAEAIAIDLGLSHEQVQRIREAALLHDIGKIGISEQILHKPGPLTRDEFEVMKSHTTLGGDLLETSHGLRDLSPYVRHHHEWWDGSGYPKRLKGEDIPLGARILAVCDSAEAMSSTRPYQRSMPYNYILEELRLNSGTQFDPIVVDSFMRVAAAKGLLYDDEPLPRPEEGDNIPSETEDDYASLV